MVVCQIFKHNYYESKLKDEHTLLNLNAECVFSYHLELLVFVLQRLLAVLYACLEFPDHSGEQTRRYALQALTTLISCAWPRLVWLLHDRHVRESGCHITVM